MLLLQGVLQLALLAGAVVAGSCSKPAASCLKLYNSAASSSSCSRYFSSNKIPYTTCTSTVTKPAPTTTTYVKKGKATWTRWQTKTSTRTVKTACKVATLTKTVTKSNRKTQRFTRTLLSTKSTKTTVWTTKTRTATATVTVIGNAPTTSGSSGRLLKRYNIPKTCSCFVTKTKVSTKVLPLKTKTVAVPTSYVNQYKTQTRTVVKTIANAATTRWRTTTIHITGTVYSTATQVVYNTATSTIRSTRYVTVTATVTKYVPSSTTTTRATTTPSTTTRTTTPSSSATTSPTTSSSSTTTSEPTTSSSSTTSETTSSSSSTTSETTSSSTTTTSETTSSSTTTTTSETTSSSSTTTSETTSSSSTTTSSSTTSSSTTSSSTTSSSTTVPTTTTTTTTATTTTSSTITTPPSVPASTTITLVGTGVFTTTAFPTDDTGATITDSRGTVTEIRYTTIPTVTYTLGWTSSVRTTIQPTDGAGSTRVDGTATVIQYIVPPIQTEVFGEPFECDNFGYLAINQNLHSVNIASGERTLVRGDVLGNGAQLGGVGYNSLDNYIYGMTRDTSRIVRIARDGRGVDLGASVNFTKEATAIDVDANGQMWVLSKEFVEAGATYQDWIQVDVNPFNSTGTFGTVVRSGRVTVDNFYPYDWASIPGGGDSLYSLVPDEVNNPQGSALRLVRFDYTTSTFVTLKVYDTKTSVDGSFGSVYADVNGDLYALHNKSGQIFKVNIFTPEVEPVTVSTGSQVQLDAISTDGAHCVWQIAKPQLPVP
ncbi:hypothetical protein TWF730_000861 [Orbilia blumenaviensis]|uniref:DUF6923 domain-containing protein n=1 Tax=Orbilia blumenaviensis TaxID=1796055 RepID=A0AAV9VQK8_9PEZI